MQLSARVERERGTVELHLTRGGEAWHPQVNGRPVRTLATLLQELAVVCLEPGSHALISGGSRERRQFLDWGVFHVEPAYWADMRQYNRALRQRNAGLKQNADPTVLAPWDAELVTRATPIVKRRRHYFEGFSLQLRRILSQFLPELGEADTALDDGYPGTDLLQALELRHKLDSLRGHTSRGPHRADWRIAFPRAPVREHLSRGQQKLCALACVLAQATMYAKAHGDWPVVLLDDLSSELDEAHQASVVELVLSMKAQTVVTGTELPAALRPFKSLTRMFHVEHGKVATLL
jgi:DNA replication and repair protein RecF